MDGRELTTISGIKSNVHNEYLASVYAVNDRDFGPLAAMHKRFSAGS